MVAQVVFVVGVFIVSGLANQAFTIEKQLDGLERQFSIYLRTYNDDGTVSNQMTVKEFRNKMSELLDYFGDDIEEFGCFLDNNDDNFYSIEWESGAESGKLGKDDNEFYNSDNIVRLNLDGYNEMYGTDYKSGDTIQILDSEFIIQDFYSAVDKANVESADYLVSGNTFYFSYKNNSDTINDMTVGTLYLSLKKAPSLKYMNEITQKICKVFNLSENNIGQPEIADLQQAQYINTIYFITFAIILIVLLNSICIYSYILSQRKNTLASMMICGASQKKSFMVFYLEIIIEIFITFTIGFILFKFVCFNPLVEIYSTFEYFFTDEIYIMIFAVYVTASLIIVGINVSRFTKKSILDMKRGGRL